MIFLWVSGLAASRTMRIRLHVRAVEMTCRPRPLPSAAPSMIPGRSRTWILAPLSEKLFCLVLLLQCIGYDYICELSLQIVIVVS
jgi:hypothetical protein